MVNMTVCFEQYFVMLAD